jgi:serine-type D-Ala-D-Ala carboxypeptidase (penicillin-binding protein 5/6)
MLLLSRIPCLSVSLDSGQPITARCTINEMCSLRLARRGLLTSIALLLVFPLSVNAQPLPAVPSIEAPEAAIIDGWTGAVLWSRHANIERYPASTVKIMTALVILNHHVPLQRVMTVSAYAATIGGSTAGLYAGEQMTVWNLLHGMLLPSGNDAAIALAEGTAGTASAFVPLMNGEAKHLHLWHTHYLTANGYDEWGQVTSAIDLADLARVAMQNPTFARIVRSRSWTVWSATGAILHHWTNLNHLLWSSRTVNGVKTGTTPGAGACLVASAQRGGRWVITVTLGGTEASRFTDGAALLNYGLALATPQPSAR